MSYELTPLGRVLLETAEHNHVTRDIKPVGKCPACDAYWGTNWGDPRPSDRAAALTATPNHGRNAT